MCNFYTEVFGHPASSVFLPKEIFEEYRLKAFNCTVMGDFLEFTWFVVKDKG